jgi:hypothetical protein
MRRLVKKNSSIRFSICHPRSHTRKVFIAPGHCGGSSEKGYGAFERWKRSIDNQLAAGGQVLR